MNDTAADAIGEIGFLNDLDKMIEEAPEEAQPVTGRAPAPREIAYPTKVPNRYRQIWERPTDVVWEGHFAKIMDRVEAGGIIALIGNRGTGKTRFAAEAVRNYSPERATYTTAMGLFLRIRASFGNKATESERDVVNEMALAKILVLDEIQERGNSAWEDRVLTHILDRRYGSMIPTIIIANLEASELEECLGASISSRINETGGTIEITGKSFREL